MMMMKIELLTKMMMMVVEREQGQVTGPARQVAATGLCVHQWVAPLARNAMQCDAIQCDTVQCDAMQCIAILYNAMGYNSIQYTVIQCNVMPCIFMQCNAMRRGDLAPCVREQAVRSTVNIISSAAVHLTSFTKSN